MKYIIIIFSKWKPGVTAVTSTSIYQLIRVESLSLYLNPNAAPSLPNYSKIWEFSNLLAWKTIMQNSLRTFAMNNDEFQFGNLILFILLV